MAQDLRGPKEYGVVDETSFKALHDDGSATGRCEIQASLGDSYAGCRSKFPRTLSPLIKMSKVKIAASSKEGEPPKKQTTHPHLVVYSLET